MTPASAPAAASPDAPSRAPAMATIDALSRAPYLTSAMFAAAELDLFTPLANGPMTAEEVADALAVPPTRLRLLLDALVAAGLLEQSGGRYANTAESNHYLVRGSEGYLGRRIEMMHDHVRTMEHTAESVRAGAPGRKADFFGMSDEARALYFHGTHPATMASARRLLERYDFSGARSLLDAGCGTGGMAITLARALPSLRATAMDLPPTTAITRQYAERAGLGDRLRVLPHDMVAQGPPPGEYDLLVCRACLQVLAPHDARRAIASLGAATAPGGTLYIIGAILDDTRATPIRAVHYNLLAINIYEAGEAYNAGQYREWLAEAGFGRVDQDMDLHDRVLIAHKDG